MGSTAGPGFGVAGMPRGPRPPVRAGPSPRPSSFGVWTWSLPVPGGLGAAFESWAEVAGDPAEASPSTAIERRRRDASMVPDSGRGVDTATYYRNTSDGAAPSGPRKSRITPDPKLDFCPFSGPGI